MSNIPSPPPSPDETELLRVREAKDRREAQERREFKDAFEAAKAARPIVEPTAGEARNGWTAESLTDYVADQTAAQSMRVNPHSLSRRTRPARANSRYSPLRWRR